MNAQSIRNIAVLGANVLGVLLTLTLCALPAHAALTEVAAILNPTPDTADGFGVDVAIDGDMAIVGAWQESTNAANAQPLANAGAAYIYQRSNGAWALVQKLVPNDRHAQQRFGYYVAISGGHTALIGATSGYTNGVPNAGAAYFFVKNGSGVWQQAQKVSAPTPEVGANFGKAVALDAAGDLAVIGAWREPAGGPIKQSGAAYVYQRQSLTSWQLMQRLAPPNPEFFGNFGTAVAIRGNHIMIGAPDESIDPTTALNVSKAGAVYHFVKTGSTWAPVQKILAADRYPDDGFGRALAFNGELLVVGSVGNDRDANGNGPVLATAGAVYVFNPTASGYTGWTQTQKLVIPAPYRTAGDQFGASVALDKNLQYLVVGAPGERHDVDEVSNPIVFTGSAYVFKLAGGGSSPPQWSAAFLQKLVASDRSYHQVFGYRVGVTVTGNTNAPAVLIGSYQKIVPATPTNVNSAGKIYFFE
ncbi:MAG: FG-GAP repeat protein [Xanthomonadaceae bacterium]|nr:FG-GAP repeat protein [Xanthomonadaceae bacterium]MDP2185799.1 FG-GAP repeat protein [Xanthomonadales bacterium]MDZ4114650.1 FG-GAP repeat protein [Xanthomonadaceae bacterium]MDZ4378226.1 FG-GAP repeat protein [Xanthomonadaceae bacterium]